MPGPEKAGWLSRLLPLLAGVAGIEKRPQGEDSPLHVPPWLLHFLVYSRTCVGRALSTVSPAGIEDDAAESRTYHVQFAVTGVRFLEPGEHMDPHAIIRFHHRGPRASPAGLLRGQLCG